MTTTPLKQDRAITFLTQEEVQRLFSAIKNKRDRAIDDIPIGWVRHPDLRLRG